MSPPTTLQPTFPSFPRLPPELQLLILTHALAAELSDPKTIYIELTSVPSKTQPTLTRANFKLHTPVPALLHTSHATRTAALEVYKPIFDFPSEGAIYINPGIDTLLVKFSPNADAITTLILATPFPDFPPPPRPSFGNTRWDMSTYEWTYCRPSSSSSRLSPGRSALWLFHPTTTRTAHTPGFGWPVHVAELAAQIADMRITCWDVYNSHVWCEDEGLFADFAWDAFWRRLRGARIDARRVESARGAWRDEFF